MGRNVCPTDRFQLLLSFPLLASEQNLDFRKKEKSYSFEWQLKGPYRLMPRAQQGLINCSSPCETCQLSQELRQSVPSHLRELAEARGTARGWGRVLVLFLPQDSQIHMSWGHGNPLPVRLGRLPCTPAILA